MSVQNYTCYNSSSGTVGSCFGGQGEGVYVDGATHSAQPGKSCTWSQYGPEGGDYGYWNNITLNRGNKKVYGTVNLQGFALTPTVVDNMAQCMAEGTTPTKLVTHPVKWDGVMIDYENPEGSSTLCPSLDGLRKTTYRGKTVQVIPPDAPIYVSGSTGIACKNTEWKNDSRIIPIYQCYDGTSRCGPASHPPHYPSNTSSVHYMYCGNNKPSSGSYDKFISTKPCKILGLRKNDYEVCKIVNC